MSGDEAADAIQVVEAMLELHAAEALVSALDCELQAAEDKRARRGGQLPPGLREKLQVARDAARLRRHTALNLLHEWQATHRLLKGGR